MDTTIPPLEPVDAAKRPAATRAEAVVVDAWVRHHEELYAFLVRTTRDPEAAEDLLQDAFVRLLREAGAGRAPDNTRAWLYRVAANLAISRGRHLQTAVRWLAGPARRSLGTQLDEAPEIGVIAGETRAELNAALAALPRDARAALALAAEGFSGAEIAACIGRTELATRTLICRARLRLRASLEGAEDVP